MTRNVVLSLFFCVSLAASAGAQVMTHSATQNILPANSVSCNAGGLHADNSYWRSFNLCSPFGIDSEISITEVQFGIENATAGAGTTTQPIEIRIYDDPNGGAPAPMSSLVLLHTEMLNVPNQAAVVFNAILTTPVTVGCNGTVVVEIFTPNGQAVGHSFFMGSNADGQTAPSYISSAQCSIPEPTDVALLGLPGGPQQYVINVAYAPTTVCNPGCSGVPVDCHDPTFGSYRIVAEDSSNFATSPGSIITDTVPSTVSSVVVTGVPGVIDNLDVAMRITHPFNGDLDIQLTDPTGSTTITLHDNLGVNLPDFDCIWDDDGRPSAPPYSLGERIAPSGPGMLADFNGLSADGTWELTIMDGVLDPNPGTLDFWELRFVRPVAIPDNDPAGATLDFPVDPSNVDEIADLDVILDIAHGNAGQLDVDLTSPAGTTVRLEASGGAAVVDLTDRYDDDIMLGGYCDGAGTAQPAGPGLMADFDGDPVGGVWSLTAVDTAAGFAGSVNRFTLLVNPAPCDEPTGLVCDSDCVTGDVTLTWTNPNPYNGGIEVRRNGMTVGTLLGGTSVFQDPGLANGTYTYEIIGDCDPGRALASCEVTHVVYNGETDIVFQLEGNDLVDSATAARDALIANGRSVLVLDSTDFACLDPVNLPATVENFWVFCGTFPANYQLTGPDGTRLATASQNGVAVYIEGVDIWGFDPTTTFQAFDGVENVSFGNIDDGLNDDTLTDLTGTNSGVGLDLSGTMAAYNQASSGPENTDRLVPCDVNPDLGGDLAGVIWTGLDPATGSYNVGIYYNSAFAPVISQSWEFGGYGGDQNALMGVYLQGLAGVSSQPEFLRGDVNADGSINIPDVIFFLNHLFVPMSADPPCFDTADTNDDGSLNLPDVIVLLNYQFVPMSAPPADPGPFMCGPDPTDTDTLPTCVYDSMVCP